eukprot:gene18230-biopygen5299
MPIPRQHSLTYPIRACSPLVFAVFANLITPRFKLRTPSSISSSETGHCYSEIDAIGQLCPGKHQQLPGKFAYLEGPAESAKSQKQSKTGWLSGLEKVLAIPFQNRALCHFRQIYGSNSILKLFRLSQVV